MGQEQSAPVDESSGREVTLEQLSKELALKFAGKCYTSLELYHFKEVFRSHAATESGLKYWKEGTLSNFLELPDVVGVDHVLYQMATTLGAFPFPSLAPCILTIEALMKLVTLMTERHTKILKAKKADQVRVLYASLAVFDRRASEKLEAQHEFEKSAADVKDELLSEISKGMQELETGDTINDVPAENHEDEDSIAIAALDLIGAGEAHRLTARPKLDHSIIPTDNLLKLIELLLLVAPLGPQESLSAHSDRLTDTAIKDLRQTAQHILASFNVENRPGVTYKNFAAAIPAAASFMFNGLAPLFEHFLFGKDYGVPSRRRNTSVTSPMTSPVLPQGREWSQSPERSRSPGSPPPPLSPRSPRASVSEAFPSFPAEPAPFLSTEGDILTKTMLCQISFFLEPSKLFHRMYPLYSGNEDGFSLGSFEKEVFSWQAPSLLLVSGTILPETPSNSRERHFASQLPPKRFRSSAAEGTRVTYGAFIPVPWHTTHRAPIGSPSCMLFQLAPTHDVFAASTMSKDYVTFFSQPHGHINGIGFGNPMPIPSPGTHAVVPIGPVSLFLDEALELAVFTNTAATGGSSSKTSGGSFQPSQIPARTTTDWQDRFEIDALEVWGVGSAEQSRQRSRTMEFEEREARLRREGRGSVGGAAGIEADREILRMAGLIGHGEEGGSMVGMHRPER